MNTKIDNNQVLINVCKHHRKYQSRYFPIEKRQWYTNVFNGIVHINLFSDFVWIFIDVLLSAYSSCPIVYCLSITPLIVYISIAICYLSRIDFIDCLCIWHYFLLAITFVPSYKDCQYLVYRASFLLFFLISLVVDIKRNYY
jgi:hypothetical protein